MDIIICPHCNMRILPNSDGTCPSCHLKIREKKQEKYMLRNSTRETNNQGVLKLAGFAVYMYCLSLFLSWIFIAINIKNGVFWLWWPGILGAILSLLLNPFLFYYGFRQRRAYKIHTIVSILTSIWILPLLATEFQLAAHGLITMLSLIAFCFLGFLLSYRQNFQKLVIGIAKQTGAININRGVWNITKPLVTRDLQRWNTSFAQLLVPLGIGLGIILSRSYPNQVRFVSSIFTFAMAYAISSYPGKHLAIAHYLRNLEKELDRPIST